MDMYGHPISLTYVEEREFKTTIGGASTVVGRLIIFAYFLAQVAMVAQNSMTVTNSSFFRDLSTDTTIYNLDPTVFDFAILVESMSGN
jgi:hypothetical protein